MKREYEVLEEVRGVCVFGVNTWKVYLNYIRNRKIDKKPKLETWIVKVQVCG